MYVLAIGIFCLLKLHLYLTYIFYINEINTFCFFYDF